MSRHEGEKGGVSFSRRMETKIEVAGLPKVKVRLGVGLKHYLIFSIKYACVCGQHLTRSAWHNFPLNV